MGILGAKPLGGGRGRRNLPCLSKPSRAALLPHGDVLYKAERDATSPARHASRHPLPQSRAALLRPGGTKPDGLPPSGELSHVHPPPARQAQSAPAAPTGAAVHGLRAKPLGPQSGGAGAQPLPSCRRGRGGLGRGSCRRPWGRLRRGLRWCSCKGCSSPRPRF